METNFVIIASNREFTPRANLIRNIPKRTSKAETTSSIKTFKRSRKNQELKNGKRGHRVNCSPKGAQRLDREIQGIEITHIFNKVRLALENLSTMENQNL